MMNKRKKENTKQLRSFGYIVGGIFGVIAMWPFVFHGAGIRIWALAISVVLVSCAFIVPSILRPVYKIWMRVGSVLGWINTRIILGLCFYGLFTPIGMLLRIRGKKPIQWNFDPKAETYRVNRAPRSPSHMLKQF